MVDEPLEDNPGNYQGPGYKRGTILEHIRCKDSGVRILRGYHSRKDSITINTEKTHIYPNILYPLPLPFLDI